MRKFLLILWICLCVCGALASAAIPAFAAQKRGIGTEFVGQPPVARLSVTPLTGQAPLQVRADASASTDGGIWPIEIYSFNFGDGSEWVNAPASAPIASHTYPSSGVFTITLFVRDGLDFFSTATAQVTVHLPPGDFPPEAALSVSPSTGEVPLTVTADASTSTDGDATPIQLYLFDFGDGSPKVGPSGSPTAQHFYGVAGTYQVTVFVTDTAGLQSKTSVPVTLTMPELPPVAVLAAYPPSGAPPLEVFADASSSTDRDATPISTFLFDFGDGSPPIGPSTSSFARHIYPLPGAYTVTVTVTDTAGLSARATAQVTVARIVDLPPSAVLTVTPSSGPPPLNVFVSASASTDTDETPISTFLFNFGDGSPPIGPSASATAQHLYTAEGQYSVTVTVTDTAGLSASATAQVTVARIVDLPPSAVLTVTPSSGLPPLNVFVDASASTDTDATPIQAYLFDFGDGSPRVGPSGSPTAHHVYGIAGVYQVTVFVTDTAGLLSRASVPVTITMPELPPVAVLRVTPSSGALPLEVYADASSSTDRDATPISTFLFDFGDGSPPIGPSASATAQHLYTVEGQYSVTVTVTDTAGLSASATAQVTVGRIGDLPPSAMLTVTPSSGPPPLTVLVNASASTDTDATPIQSYRFDFGDGSPPIGPSASATAQHLYTVEGQYSVTVTVTDTAGLSGSATARVTVARIVDFPPNAVLTVTPSSGPPPLTVFVNASASTDTDATPISTFLFDFGDGSPLVGPSTSPFTQHIYPLPGAYTVTVFVTDTAGLRSSTSRPVQVSQFSLIGNPGFEGSTSGWKAGGTSTLLERILGGRSGAWAARLVNTGTTRATCTLNDSPNWVDLTSLGSYKGSMWVRADAPGARLKLRFREYVAGASIAAQLSSISLLTTWQQVTLTYIPAAPGRSTLDFNALISDAPPGTCFYADDATIEFDSGAIAGNGPPTAVLSVTPGSGAAPLDVVADASGSIDPDTHPIQSYLFFFGDGAPPVGPQTGPTVAHTFDAPGLYTVTIVVVDALGLASSASAQVEVTVPSMDAPPRAALTVIPGAGSAPLTVTADASASIDPDSSPIATYLFDFGDGTPLVGPQAVPTAQHTYAAAGVYTIRVTVSDTAGLAADATAAVTVNGPGEIALNSGFEANTSGWQPTRSKLALERVAGGHSGEWAARLSNSGTGNVSCGLNDSPNWVTRTAPGSYVASLWVRADAPGATLKLLLREYNGGALVGSQWSTVVLSTSWQQVVTSYAPGAPGLSTLDFSAYISSSPPGTCFYADDVSITLR